MDKISIDLLSSNPKDGDKTNYSGPNSLSVYSLAKNHEKHDCSLQIDNLIKTRRQKRKKLLIEYNKLFSRCIERIETANGLNQTEILFDIPVHILGCNEYVVSECLRFIENKLRSLDIDTLKITNNSLYITWIYIELNRSYKDEQSKNN